MEAATATNRLLRAAPALEAPKLGLQIAPVLPGRRPRGLDQHRLQPGSRVTDPGRAALPRTLVQPRAQARPRDQMARIGKPGHVHADLGDDHPRDRLTDPGHRRQPLGGLAKRAQHLVGLAAPVSARRRVAHRSAPGAAPAGNGGAPSLGRAPRRRCPRGWPSRGRWCNQPTARDRSPRR